MELSNRLFLKVKIKSLEAEARIIRREESLAPRFRQDLLWHRKYVVGTEQRHTLLAYGFIRGLKYREIENGCNKHNHIKWDKVRTMVFKYGSRQDDGEFDLAFEARRNQLMFEFDKWLKEAREYRRLCVFENTEKRLQRMTKKKI